MVETKANNQSDAGKTTRNSEIIEVDSRIGPGGPRVKVEIIPGENGEPGKVADVVFIKKRRKDAG